MTPTYSAVTSVLTYMIDDHDVAPEDVFSFNDLKDWALENGFSEKEE